MVTPWPRLTQKARITSDRLFELTRGADPTNAEIAALAAIWLVPPEGLRASIADSRAAARREHARLRDDDRSAA